MHAEQSDRHRRAQEEVQALLDGLPEDMPVLIDEAYHHYVDDPPMPLDPVHPSKAVP